MWKYFYHKKTHTWINVLDDFFTNYNGSKNRSIGVRPADVNKTNQHKVWITLYGQPGTVEPPQFNVGDLVRVTSYKSVFTKGYEANFLEEVYELTRVLRGDPTMYKLMDPEDN